MSKYFEKAGAIIVRENEGVRKVLLEYRGRAYLKDWTFPKGGVETGETPEETTKREIREETGLEIELVKPLPDIYYHNSHDGDVRVTMFLAEPKTQKLQTEVDSDRLEWVPFEQVAQKLTYKNLKDYFESVKDSLDVPILKN